MKPPLKISFLDRDGTLIYEPEDTKRIDALRVLKILPGVIEGLKNLKQAGYELVMVSNQDGIGSRVFPREKFEKPQAKLLDLLKKEGVTFAEIFICPHAEEANCDCRKPKTGLLTGWLKDVNIDRSASFMLGDRETDLQFAGNLGIFGMRMPTNAQFPRMASVCRKTAETDVFVLANLDGQGRFKISTGLKFFDHMLEQFSKHSLVDLIIQARGDLQVDEHHTVEDTALVLGKVLSDALGKRKGVRRYGFLLPMDDALVEVALDLGGRPYFLSNMKFRREKVGDLPTELVEHFFHSLADMLRANLHIRVRYGKNEHHQIEAIFKAVAKAFRAACEEDLRLKNILPSTKGVL